MTHLSLTSAQQGALGKLREACAIDYRTHPKVIVVQGFSGVGKSALVDSVEDELKGQGHLVLDPEELLFAQRAVDYMNHEGQILVAAGFYHAEKIESSLKAIANPVNYEFYDVDWDHVLKREIHFIDLKGMNADEMRAYATARKSKSLMLDGIVECSVGLPGLANELMDIPHVDLELGRRLSALHLWNNINRVWNNKKYFERFLNIQPTPEIRALFDKGFHHSYSSEKRHIYDRLPALRANYWRDKVPEDVTFVAPESIDVYTESLGNDHTRISIYMPRLSTDEFDAIAKLMGYTGEDYSFGEITPRWHMFGVNQKELSSYGHIGKKDFGMIEWEPMTGRYLFRRWRVQAATYEQAIKTGLIPFPDRPRDASFIVTVNDHGGVNEQPINLGWMLESFLQQRGIAYVADNGMCGKSYVFNPTKRKLEFLESGTSRKIYDLEREVEKGIPY